MILLYTLWNTRKKEYIQEKNICVWKMSLAMIHKIFLFFEVFETYKKNSYKKDGQERGILE